MVQAIPTASMADIAFLLLIFFMSTTMFKVEDGLPIEMPKAEADCRRHSRQWQTKRSPGRPLIS